MVWNLSPKLRAFRLACALHWRRKRGERAGPGPQAPPPEFVSPGASSAQARAAAALGRVL